MIVIEKYANKIEPSHDFEFSSLAPSEAHCITFVQEALAIAYLYSSCFRKKNTRIVGILIIKFFEK